MRACTHKGWNPPWSGLIFHNEQEKLKPKSLTDYYPSKRHKRPRNNFLFTDEKKISRAQLFFMVGHGDLAPEKRGTDPQTN